MDTTDFDGAFALMTLVSIVFGALFLAVAVLSSLFGEQFINLIFGG